MPDSAASEAPSALEPSSRWWHAVGIQSLPERAAFILVVAVLGYLATLFARRVAYPFELEWMEGGMVDHVARVLAGRSLYAEPSIEFTSYIYNPLFSYVGAAASALAGPGFAPLRLVSILATCACFGLIFVVVRKEGCDRTSALSSTAIFGATYAWSGMWFDIARIDMLFLALALGAWLAVRHAESRRGFIIGALLTALCFLAKQPGLGFIPFFAVVAFVRHRPGAGWYLGVSIALVATIIAALCWTSDGWYWFYAFRLPALHGHLSGDHYAHVILVELVSVLPACVVLAVLWITSATRRASGPAISLACLIVPLLGVTIVGRLHAGGSLNTLIPAYAALSVCFGLGGQRLRHWERSATDLRMRSAVLALALLQVGMLQRADRGVFLPTAEDREAGARFVEELAAVEGEVLVTHHGHLASMANKPTHAHLVALIDIMKAEGDLDGRKAGLRDLYRQAFAEQRFARVIIDDEAFPFMRDLRRSYERAAPAEAAKWAGFFTKTGNGSRLEPDLVFVPRRRP